MKLCVNHHIVYHQSYDLGLINRIQSSLPNRYQEANLGGHWQQKMRAQNDLAMFMKTSGYSPLSSMKPMLVQMPVFVSVFLALRFVCDQVDSVLCAFNMATKKKNLTLFFTEEWSKCPWRAWSLKACFGSPTSLSAIHITFFPCSTAYHCGLR